MTQSVGLKSILNLIKIQIYKRCDSNGFLTTSYTMIKFEGVLTVT